MQRIPGGVLIGLALAPTLALADDLDAVRRMSICGPRCVQRVLEFYGQKEDLATLVREMQGGVVNEFSSFHGIEEALSRRGVHALPVQYGVLGFPNWREPVILHYREGHFVVLSETKGGFVKIHDGILHPPTWEPLPSVMLRQSGAVLLTSKSPIRPVDVSELWWPRVVAACGCLGLGGAVWLLRRCWNRVSHNRHRLETHSGEPVHEIASK